MIMSYTKTIFDILYHGICRALTTLLYLNSRLNKCHNKVIIICTNCQVGNDVQYGTKIIIAIVVQKLLDF